MINVADKPYAELIEAVKGEYDGSMLAGLLKAAMVLPPQRAMMMLAVCVITPYVSRTGFSVRPTLWAFIEEARWRSL